MSNWHNRQGVIRARPLRWSSSLHGVETYRQRAQIQEQNGAGVVNMGAAKGAARRRASIMILCRRDWLDDI